MVGDVMPTFVVCVHLVATKLAISGWIEALVRLPYRVCGRSPSVASLADDTSLVRAFGDVSHDGLVKVWVTMVSIYIPRGLYPPPPVSSWDAPDFRFSASGIIPVHECQYLSGAGL